MTKHAESATSAISEDSEPPQEEKQLSNASPTIPETGSILNLSLLPKRSRTVCKNIKNTITRSTPRFPQFAQLPTELRLKIWKAAFEPRVHELHPCAKLYNERMTFRSNSSSTPPLFHASHESREVALKHHKLMSYMPVRPSDNGKGILRFYFCPKLDTLLLNSLMGLFMMFVLLEENRETKDYEGVMDGWETVAFDAERAQLITLLSGIPGHSAQPRIKAVFPDLKELVIAFDYSKNGKTRFRTSVWPGENGTSLKRFPWPMMQSRVFEEIFKPMKEVLDSDYAEGQGIPEMLVAKVKRKVFIRGDVRYVFRKGCAFIRVRPRGVFRRI